MKVKQMLLALFAAAVLGTVAAQPVQIEAWHSLGTNFGGPEFEALVAEFNASQDDIFVEVVYAGEYTPALQRAQAALAAGNPPNVAMFEQTRGAGFVDAGAILALNDFIEADEEVSMDDFFARLLLACTYGDMLYCVPYNASTPLVYYNADIFREAGLDPETDVPSTWDELLEVGPQLSVPDGRGGLERWALGLATSPGWLFDAWLGQAGGRFLNEDGTQFIFNSEAGVEVAEFWLELIDRGIAVASSSQTEDFFAGRQAMILASTANLENYFRQAEFDLRAAPLWCHTECYAPIGGGNFYLMDTGTDAEKQASWEFLKWILAPEQSARFAAATGYMAPMVDALETETLQTRFAELPEARITYDQMSTHGYPRTLVPFWNEVHSAYGTATEEILLAGVDPQRALDVAAQEANRLLEVYAR
jgi:sn-glycerol 3-phosphate transport system substrate-binding protein